MGFNTIPTIEPGTPETIGFDVKISSPKLALSSVRRIYLRCKRKANRLVYRDHYASRNGAPVFDVIHHEAAQRFGYAPHSLDAVLRT